MTRLLPYLVAFVTALGTLGFLLHRSKASMSVIEERQDSAINYVQRPLCDETEEKRFRVSFGAGPGALVQGWPSKGGVYMLEDCFAIELDFLKLDRFQNTPQPSPSSPDAAAEEEAHCNRMRQLGATWWKSDRRWTMTKLLESTEPQPNRPVIKAGWPAGGGVWVLNITESEAYTRGVGILYNAYDMEDRCRLIKQLGGVFFENPKDWKYLSSKHSPQT